MKLLLPGDFTTIIAATFSCCLLVQAAAKVVYSLKKLDFKTQGSTEFITPSRPLVAPSLCLGTTVQGLQVMNSVDPCVMKSNYYVKLQLS